MTEEIKVGKNIVVLRVSLRYVTEDATEEDTKVLAAIKKSLKDSIETGSVLVLPSIVDDYNKQCFEIEVHNLV